MTLIKALELAFPDLPLDVSEHDEGYTITNREGGYVPTDAEVQSAMAAYTAPTIPRVKEAFEALLTSAVYARVTNVASAHNVVSVPYTAIGVNFAMALGGNVYRDALNAAIAQLDTALKQSALLNANALTSGERAWIENWDATYGLGLTLPWRA